MKVRIITASAGTGKTTRLSEILDEAIGARGVAPERVVATTFTREAAAQLIERARSRLLASGRGAEAHQLLAARIGTVNSVCGALVSEHAFELGLSPELRVLDETAAEVALRRALAGVVSSADAAALEATRRRFLDKLDWRHEVRKLIEASRTNRIDSGALRGFARRSITELDECLGRCEHDGEAIDAALLAALDQAIDGIDVEDDPTKGTADYLDLITKARRDLAGGRLRWGEWAKLCQKTPRKKSLDWAGPVMATARRHRAHPGLRGEMHRFIERLYTIAADGLAAYQAHKRERGVIDYIDQETLALELLEREDVRADLAGQIELVLIDEFQDTSPLQLAIFLELARLAGESVWVGDPKQAIFAFRGADPRLMDAAIESLSSPSVDPDLVQSAADAVAAGESIETLAVSYRSRPALVDLTSAIFARAFASQGMPERRTRLRPADEREPAGLGPVIEHWPILDGRSNGKRAAAVAAGARDFLARGALVRDRDSSVTRPARAGDLAILCRTNAQCQSVADALAALGVEAVVPRMGLLETAEGQLVLAGLRLWLDPGDALAAAHIARLVSHPIDGDGFLARALEAPGIAAFAADPIVAAILAARRADSDRNVVGAVDAVIDASGARELAAAWGRSDQRRANLDALRGHACRYAEDAAAGRDAATLAGLLATLEEMADDSGWTSSRSDAQALLGAADAVTVSTWHRAKGLEWPVTILYGLETVREPDGYGVRVVSDAGGFDVEAPLAGRWIRFWPNPYTTANQKGPIRDAYEASPAFADARERADREALRVLYVGWTRARDRLILAAQKGKLLGGLLGKLAALDPELIDEPARDGGDAGPVPIAWAGRALEAFSSPCAAAEPVEIAAIPGEIIAGRPAAIHPAARLSPSAAAPVPCAVGQIVDLGPRLRLLRSPADVAPLGDAVHGFFAADDPDLEAAERGERAAALLAGFGVGGCLDPLDVVAAADRLWSWLETTLPGTALHREVPVQHRLAGGTVVAGFADLVATSARGFVLVDHKTFPGELDAALERILDYSGQLAAYAAAIEAATGLAPAGLWIHLPILGAAIDLRI